MLPPLQLSLLETVAKFEGQKSEVPIQAEGLKIAEVWVRKASPNSWSGEVSMP